MKHFTGDRICGVEHCEQEHMVWLLPFTGFLCQLDFHQLGWEQDRVADPLYIVSVVVHPRPLGQGTQGVLIEWHSHGAAYLVTTGVCCLVSDMLWCPVLCGACMWRDR